MFMTLYSANDEGKTIEVEVTVLDQTGQAMIYKRSDGISREQILAQREEQDSRKIVAHIIWPGEFKGFLADECKDAKQAVMEKIRATLYEECQAEHVDFGKCTDRQGNTMWKTLLFVRHSPSITMADFGKKLSMIKYVDIGLQILIRISLNKKSCDELGIKQCCFRDEASCVRGHVEPGRNGRAARPAPKCNMQQLAYASRICFNRFKRSDGESDKQKEKRLDEEMHKAAAQDTISKAYKPPQECRAHEAGRCTKGDLCTESHNVPDIQILCCSVLKEGVHKYFNKRFRTCTALRIGQECTYSHEIPEDAQAVPDSELLEG